jgi:ABC-2 type transport system ATP-binding protein
MIISSHLLSEIERVCDHLVEIEGGRLIRSSPMTALTAPTRVLQIEVEGDGDSLAATLNNRGIAAHRRGRYILVEKGDDAILDTIRDTIVELDVGLIRLEQSRRRLEELFQPEPEEQPADA